MRRFVSDSKLFISNRRHILREGLIFGRVAPDGEGNNLDISRCPANWSGGTNACLDLFLGERPSVRIE
jgi:hypothetical protein